MKVQYLQMLGIFEPKDTGIGDEFKFNKFVSQMGLGSGLGLRIHVAYITVRLDLYINCTILIMQKVKDG